MDIRTQLRALLDEDAWTQVKVADRIGVSQSTVARWLGGTEPEGRHRDAIKELYAAHFGEDQLQTSTVPLMGFVGAGAEVEPDFEQVPEDGLDQVEVPFPLPAEMIALQVRGDSMLPMFDDGMVIIVYREQRRATESFFGERAVVRTAEGRRYIKTIIKGEGATVSLLSWNAQPIQNVHAVWIGEIFTFFPANSLRRTARQIARQGGIQGQLRSAG